ncbi:hypothetical protein EG329_010006 [Mollisiaceae sp. DMI_Dod_QoI]|nr:hypothetical protein EG329_010006 [Helotiales sp. DMI_Dod_QoI]
MDYGLWIVGSGRWAMGQGCVGVAVGTRRRRMKGRRARGCASESESASPWCCGAVLLRQCASESARGAGEREETTRGGFTVTVTVTVTAYVGGTLVAYGSVW